ACTSSTKDKKGLSQLEWLLGNWQRSDGEREYIEHWKKVNDTLFEADGLLLKSGDTLMQEHIQLVYREDSVYFIPTVKSQNKEDEAVAFTMVFANRDTFAFQNKEHDFPQLIVYTFHPPDTLKAW